MKEASSLVTARLFREGKSAGEYQRIPFCQTNVLWLPKKPSSSNFIFLKSSDNLRTKSLLSQKMARPLRPSERAAARDPARPRARRPAQEGMSYQKTST